MDKNYDTSFSEQWLNLADERLDTQVLQCSDDFFAGKENLIKTAPPVFDPHDYCDTGKVMDGWESRRKREVGHDHVIIKLGSAGIIKGVDVDTSHFTGNYPESFSLDAGVLNENNTIDWIEIISDTELTASSQHLIHVKSNEVYSYVRLHIYPDGGVARLKVYGEPFFDASQSKGKLINLAAIQYGAKAIQSSNEHFGEKKNLLFPSKSKDMSDGWETKRRRGMNWSQDGLKDKFSQSGYDWVIIQLAETGSIDFFDLDTHFFKGNFPYACSIDVAKIDKKTKSEDIEWTEIIGSYFPKANQQHIIEVPADLKNQKFSHVRLNIYPDGGVARFKVFGFI